MAGIVWRTAWPVLLGIVLMAAAGRARRPRRVASAALALGLLAAVTLAAGAADDGWRFRLWPCWRCVGGPLLAVGWCGMALLGVWVPRTRRRALPASALAVYLAVASQGPCAAYWHGHQASRRNFANAAGLVKQSTHWTCVPAASAMLLARSGLRVSEGALAEAAGTMPTVGTHTADMVGVLAGPARRLGLAARGAVLSGREADRLGRPFLTVVAMSPKLRHCVMVERMESDRVSVADPLPGRRYTFSRALWETMWQHTCIWLEER